MSVGVLMFAGLPGLLAIAVYAVRAMSLEVGDACRRNRVFGFAWRVIRVGRLALERGGAVRYSRLFLSPLNMRPETHAAISLKVALSR